MKEEKTAEQLYQEREKRVVDAIELKTPDRVPIVVSFDYFAAKYNGMTCEDAYYNFDKWVTAYKKTLLDFQPDMVFRPQFFPGIVLELLGPKQIKWPGHGVPSDHSHQAVEAEYMKADEYDAFLEDLSDFMLRIYIPRIYGTLKPLERLPALWSATFGHGAVTTLAQVLAAPEFAEALDALVKAGRELSKLRPSMRSFEEEITELGFPQFSQAGANAPFDVIPDYLRGMRGTMVDMYRQPDKLLASCEKLLPLIIKRAVSGAKRSGNPRVSIPLHRGSHVFMSLKQFETFYWPTLKRLILALVDEGLVPCVFFEGDYTSRLGYLLELPKGKVLGHFDTTDIFKAKEVLKDHVCIRGNVPSSILQTGTPQDVKDYCKKLIDVVGKDGGYIMSPRSSLDEVKPENLKAMIEFTKEYGVYR